jgi:hypothetical protein
MRMSVIEGGQPGQKPGEYTLVDTLDSITIDPATRTFTRLNFAKALSEVPTAGVSAGIDRVEASMDSVSMIDTVTGANEMRYTMRVKSVTVVKIDPSRLPPGMEMPDMRVTVIQTSEFWYALGPDDDTPRPPAAPRRLVSQLAQKMTDGYAMLPRRRSVRSSTVNRTETGTEAYEIRTASRILKQETVTLDPDRFVIPAGYTEKPMAGAAPADSAWLARWMARP